MTVQKLNRTSGSPLRFCHNGCRSDKNVLRASYVVWIIGRPTFVCGRCAKGWPVVWEQALGVAA